MAKKLTREELDKEILKVLEGDEGQAKQAGSLKDKLLSMAQKRAQEEEPVA